MVHGMAFRQPTFGITPKRADCHGPCLRLYVNVSRRNDNGELGGRRGQILTTPPGLPK